MKLWIDPPNELVPFEGREHVVAMSSPGRGNERLEAMVEAEGRARSQRRSKGCKKMLETHPSDVHLGLPMRPGLTAASLLVVSFAAYLARAENMDRTLRYEVPEGGCPPASVFEATVARFSPRVFLVERDGLVEALTVRVRRDASSFRGGARFGATSEWIEGDTCGEVVEALARISARMIDGDTPPLARAAMPLGPPEPPPAPSWPPPPPQLAAPKPAVGDVRSASQPPVPPPRSDSDVRPRWHADIDGAGALRTGLSPEAMGGASLGVSLRSTAPRVLAPAVGVSVTYVTSGPFDSIYADATYKLVSGQVTACSLRILRISPLAVFPCVVANAGAIIATGESPTVAHLAQATPFWADVDVILRGTVDLNGPFFFVVDGGAGFSLVQPRFVFEAPTRPVSSVSTVGFVGSFGLGVTFL